MDTSHVRNLFQLQTELVDAKVDMAVGRSMDKIVSEIHSLRDGLKKDIRDLGTEISNLHTEVKLKINDLRSEVKLEINNLRTEFKADIQELRTELKADIQELRTELKVDIHELRTELKTDIHELRHDMNKQFGAQSGRITAAETKLGLANDRQREIRNRLFDYGFKATWLLLGAGITYLFVEMHTLIK